MEIKVERAADGSALNALMRIEEFDFVAVHGNCELLSSAGVLRPENGRLHGATSCLGAMTQDGPTDGVAAFGILDPDGAYGTAMRAFDVDPRAASRRAARDALHAADRIGERPDLVWVSATPGTEEAVLDGIESIVGKDVPIIGGSAADNSVAGGWFVFDGQARSDDGVVVSVLFPSTGVSFAYQNGYSPTASRGVVTRASGRTIHEIDGQPALSVYRDWANAAVDQPGPDEDEVAILSQSTFWPLGREITQLGEVPFYLLAHPAVARRDGSIDLFATVETGEELTLMSGTADGLTTRAGRVATLARMAGRMDASDISGALMIYCGGCMLSVQDRLDEVVSGVNEALDGAPFLGAFTFGEQGALVRAGNRHGNLMISCIVFG